MLTYLKYLCVFAVAFLPVVVVAQSGPGGVSNDNDPINPEKNCRLWLDAGDLSYLSDGSYVHVWKDKSNSAHVDTAIWLDGFQEKFDAPLFRSDPAYSINGKPVISFEDGGMLLMGRDQNNKSQNPDLSADGPSKPAPKRTVFVAFRTGNNITSRQYLWEQGGGWKGMGIFISNSYLYIGVYNLPSGDGISQFGYCYKKAQVQPNTTYVVSMVLDAPTDGSLNTSVSNNTALLGTINGGNFGNLEQGASKLKPPLNYFGVGAIGAQGDPIGIGGVNSLAADEISINDWSSAGNPCVGFTPCNNTLLKSDSGQTGQFTFKGRIAEICYYAYNLNDAERIIVENYLAAKYFANIISNDKFEYQANYGNDVIGIGAQANGDDHNHSKGDNLFEISVDNMSAGFKFAAGSRYLLVGHNGNPVQWSNQNTPDSSNVQRLRRTWRFDRNGFSGSEGDQTLKIKLNSADLPTLPGPDYKLAVLIDYSNGPLPNFSASPQVIELPNIGGTLFQGKYLIPDGAYFTIAAVKPTIQFRQNSAFTLETDDPTPTVASVDVELNYTPQLAVPINTGVIFTPGTATIPEDFTTSGNTITISPPNRIGTLPFNIINDLVIDSPPVKDFLIVLNPSATDNGYFIGKRDTLIYKIYDDDPDPKATFTTAINDSVSEAGIGGGGLAQIDVRINGTTTSSQNRTVRIIDDFTGTATYGVDYTLPNTSGWASLPNPDIGRYMDISVPSGTNLSSAAFFNVFTDNLDENDESIHFRLEPRGDIGIDGNSIINHTINLIDINPEPVVEFLATNSEGFEAVSQPRIVVALSGPSAKTIEVPFIITGGTATNGANQSNSDYTAETTGSVVFAPGDTVSYLYYDPNTGNIALQVYSDMVTEPDETIEFELQEPLLNAQLGSGKKHVYTIKDYQEFEWTGAAGVGKARDNIFWIDLDDAVPGQNGNVPQRSPRPIDILQPKANNQPTVAIGRNNQKVIDFNGSSFYRVSGSTDGKSPFINTAGFYDSKSIFFVVTLPASISSTQQVIFEEGGDDKGLNIYLKNNKIYFQAWNVSDDDGLSENLAPWGSDNSFAMSNTLNSNQTYVVSCHYQNGAEHPLQIYVDGDLQGMYGSNNPAASDYIGRLYVHGDKIGIGGMYYKTRFDTGPQSGNLGFNFKGQVGEMIYYNDRGTDMNTARIRIVHNYLSARFNIPLIPSEQIFDLTYADQTNTSPGYVTYNSDVAGIGIIAPGNLHGVAEGPAQMKVSGTSLSGTNKFIMWGHNNKSLTDTWPYSYWNASLPAGVQERSGRVWRFSENFASASSLEIEMNFSKSGNAPYLTNHRELLRLLVNSNADDWSTATVYSPSATQPNPGEGARVVFDNVIIHDGDYVALGNTSPINIAPLPIELLNFNARFEVDHVNISWATASEINNEYFEIERAGSDLKWKKIAQISGAGNSNTTLYYKEKDRNPLKGIAYYRLKQIDFDGNYKYSDVVSVVNNQIEDEDEVFIYPNPINGGNLILRIPYSVSSSKTTVSIFDLSGKKVITFVLPEGEMLAQINIDRLDAGAYLVHIQSDLLEETKKLIVN